MCASVCTSFFWAGCKVDKDLGPTRVWARPIRLMVGTPYTISHFLGGNCSIRQLKNACVGIHEWGSPNEGSQTLGFENGDRHRRGLS